MITIRGLQKKFRGKPALRGVDLDVPEGKVTAFLGPNGAGKTTTLQCAMGLLEPDAGHIEVMGARRLSPELWKRMGYVSENQCMPEWLTVPKLLDYVRPMYGKQWDRDFEKRLLRDLDLPQKTPLRSLSRGQRMKAALVSSLAYRPQLVVLDEPFTGLDALVRDEFLTSLLELTETEGWTVWISSHDIEEVERFADRVAILRDGMVHLQEEVTALQARFRQIELVTEEDLSAPLALPPDWVHLRVEGRAVRLVHGDYDEVRSKAVLLEHFSNPVHYEVRPMSLREIFVTLARSFRTTPQS
ncbi:ABC-2 type transport system ATP-binding protein [Haloferula luteola]|uniref:ABC-2 type transport system ATP-binding protein n=1 Tax=Haloferula luteola TaxID=595692 RepID=A0A840V3H9_9BACT|nr:ABC transporter ATP-binding protein [Haloferula luteola]MBB5350214.1 ABC-2 type transport system ATP-binding protein [Haloferula luteola]